MREAGPDRISADHNAFEQVRQLDSTDGEFAKKMPVLIRSCGLAQALAFAEAKDKAPQLRKALEEWIAKTMPTAAGKTKAPILERILASETDFLFRATDEALAYLFWIGRFCEAKEKKGAQKQ